MQMVQTTVGSCGISSTSVSAQHRLSTTPCGIGKPPQSPHQQLPSLEHARRLACSCRLRHGWFTESTVPGIATALYCTILLVDNFVVQKNDMFYCGFNVSSDIASSCFGPPRTKALAYGINSRTFACTYV